MKHRYFIGAVFTIVVVLCGCKNPADGTSSQGGWRLFYDGKGSDGGEVPVDERVYQYADPVIVLGNRGALYKNGYRFVGWEKEGMLPASEGDVFLFPGPGQDETLYAAWEYQPGSIDLAFHTGDGKDPNGSIESVLVQSDGKILLGGSFATYDGIPAGGIVRLNSDGTVDSTFQSGSGFGDSVASMALQPDGRILVGGWFSAYNSTPCKRLVRLNSNGSLDSSFDLQLYVPYEVNSVAVQPNGYILLGGLYLFGRVDSTGDEDTSFAGAGGSPLWCRAIELQDDGRILVGGAIDSLQGTPVGNFARVDSAGALDPTFDNGLEANGEVYAMKVFSDNSIIVGGSFTALGGQPVNHLAILGSTGGLYSGMSSSLGYGPNRLVSVLSTTAEDDVFVGGFFTQYDACDRPGLALATNHGELLSGFLPEVGANRAVLVLPDGKILAAGMHRICRIWPRR